MKLTKGKMVLFCSSAMHGVVLKVRLKKPMYRDSGSQWEAVCHKGTFIVFPSELYPLTEEGLNKAELDLSNRYKRDRDSLFSRFQDNVAKVIRLGRRTGIYPNKKGIYPNKTKSTPGT